MLLQLFSNKTTHITDMKSNSYLKRLNGNSSFLLFTFDNIKQFANDLVRYIVNMTSTLSNNNIHSIFNYSKSQSLQQHKKPTQTRFFY